MSESFVATRSLVDTPVQALVSAPFTRTSTTWRVPSGRSVKLTFDQ